MAQATKQFIVNENGEKTAVILSIEEYEELLEDIEDLAIIAERRDEPTEPLSVVKERLERKWQSIEST
jgi:PHD/YefM family antitoxin component YafN of YafNO toxin-antitoxin module